MTDAGMEHTYSVQVKTTNSKPATFWLVGKRAGEVASDSYIYVFVNIRPKPKTVDEVDYFIVPSRRVEKKMVYQKAKATATEWYSFSCRYAEPFRDKWTIFGRKS